MSPTRSKKRRKHRKCGRRSRSHSESRSRSRDRAERRKKRESVEDKIDALSTTILNMQNIMLKKGIFEDDVVNPRDSRKGRQSDSGTTIYKNVLSQEDVQVDDEIVFHVKDKKWDSSSSEEPINTSDEIYEVDCDQFIADCVSEVNKQRDERKSSHGHGRRDHERTLPPPPPEQRGLQMVREAESARGILYPSPGKENGNPAAVAASQIENIYNEYMVIGAHVDQVLQEKIVNFEYIYFARLLPKDCITKIEDHRLELVNKGGYTYFAPV